MISKRPGCSWKQHAPSGATVIWWAYELSADPTQLDRLGATLNWIGSSEDRPIGEWFATTNPDGTAAGADHKRDEYKASYHDARALVFLRDWIDAELTRPAISAAPHD
jgi:hypothetical protein